MKYPCLVPKRLCKTEIHVHLESEGTDEYGQSEKVLDLDLLCNFQDGAKTVWTDEKEAGTDHRYSPVFWGYRPGLAFFKRWYSDGVR